MKKILSIFLMVIMPFTSLLAQRLLPHQKGLQISVGRFSNDKPKDNYFVNLELTTNHKKGNYHFFSTEYQRRTAFYAESPIPIETFLLSGGYSFRLIGLPNKSINLNTGIEASGGYQQVNHNKLLLQDGSQINNKSSFVYGAGGRLTLETYLTNFIIISIQARAKYIWGTDFNQFRPSAGIGLRFNL
ncbi:conjugal transfer protein TraO [Chryseobacterium sp. Marseille-Q8038]